MKHLTKYISFFLLALIIIAGISGASQKGKISPILPAHAQSSTHNVTGYAWSDNIGWLSFSDPRSTVTMAADGTLTGYAWSDNIGWVSFNAADVTSCPAGSCTPKVDTTAGTVTGWARAVAGCQDSLWDGNSCTGAGAGDANGIYLGPGTPGEGVTWDGWIDLSGIIFNPSNGSFTGYGWGSDVVGWIAFNAGASGVECDPTLEVCTDTDLPICSINAVSSSVPSGSTANLNWTTSNATACELQDTAGNTLSTDLSSSGIVTNPLTSPETFSLYCSNAKIPTPTLCSSATVNINGGASGGAGLWLKNNVFTTNVTARPNVSIPVNWDVSAQVAAGYSCSEKTSFAAGPWTTGTALPADTSPNGHPVITLSNLATGIYNLSILCTKGAVSTSTNTVTISVIPSSINEK